MRTILKISMIGIICVMCVYVGKAYTTSSDVNGEHELHSELYNEWLYNRKQADLNHVFMYVYNEKEEMWERATNETLKNAKCEYVRVFYRRRD